MMDFVPALVATAIILPFCGAALSLLASSASRTARDLIALITTGGTLLASVLLIAALGGGYPAVMSAHLLLGEATFVVDRAGHLFAVLVSFLWLCCTLAALDYLSDKRAARYQGASLAVLGGMMGVAVAGDLIVLFLFFEIAGLASYLLVAHKRTDASIAAANKYLAMTLLSGFALLAGILIIFQMGGDGLLVPMEWAGSEVGRLVAASLLVLGFGIKAGMVPVHVWLPDAHPVAPSPASALLSGLIIKTGAFGIFRTLWVLYGPVEGASAGWDLTGQHVGWILLVIGVVSMVAGVFMALGQHNMKRMLAYSSVSQIGFVLAGLGAAVYLVDDAYGAYGLAGSLYHVVNHALYKAVLFLGAGAVLIRAGTVDMRKLGGLRTRMPLTFSIMLIAALGITGMPLINGFASKSLIHHAVAAAEPFHLWGIGPLEVAFVLAGGGTFAVLFRLLSRTFGGEAQGHSEGATVGEAPPRTLLAMAVPALTMLVLGLAPLALLRGVLEPVTMAYGLDPAVLIAYRQFTAEHLAYAALTVVTGTALLAFDAKTGALSRPPLPWLSLDLLYRRTASAMLNAAQRASVGYEDIVGRLAGSRHATRTSLVLAQRRLSRARRSLVASIVEGTPAERYRAATEEIVARLEAERDSTVARAIEVANDIQQEAPACPGRGCEEYIDAVRDIAEYLAQRVFTEHAAVATEAARHDPERSIEAVKIALRDVGESTAETIVSHSAEFALERMRGHNTIPDMSALVVQILRAERFPRRLRQAMTTFWDPDSQAGDAPTTLLTGRPGQPTWLGGVTALFVDIARIIVGAFTRERTDWGEEPPEQQRVVHARLLIQRASRDLQLGVFVMVAGLLIFVLLLSAS